MMGQHPDASVSADAARNAFVFASLAAAAFGIGMVWRRRRRSANTATLLQKGALAVEEFEATDELPIPDKYKDPITFSVMKEPVVLSGTGQVYDLHSLQEWFRMGNRLCPKTNIELFDIQVTKLPWLKEEIKQWQAAHGMPSDAEEEEEDLNMLAGIHLQLPAWVRDIRSDTGSKRTKAATEVYELIRQWEQRYGSSPEAVEQLRCLREAVLDDMVWLIRYADTYLKGVAASVLAQCNTAREVTWLAATATVPAVMLCLSPNTYTSQFHIARAGEVARRTIIVAGGVQSLLKVVGLDRAEYGYCRDRAVAVLAVLAKDPEVLQYLQRHALQPLKAMLLHSPDRWEKRDAATALLKLQLAMEQLDPELSIDNLCKHWWCSRAWLDGTAAQPDQGYTPEELRQHADWLHMGWPIPDLLDYFLGHDLNAAPVAAQHAQQQGQQRQQQDSLLGQVAAQLAQRAQALQQTLQAADPTHGVQAAPGAAAAAAGGHNGDVQGQRQQQQRQGTSGN